MGEIPPGFGRMGSKHLPPWGIILQIRLQTGGNLFHHSGLESGWKGLLRLLSPPPRSAPVNGIVLGGWSGSLPCSQCHPGGQRPCPPALQCRGRGGRGCTSSSTEALQRHMRLNFRGDRLRHCPMPCKWPLLAFRSQRDSAGGRTRETALTPTTKLSSSRKGVLVTRRLVPLPGLFRSSPGAQD